MMRSRLPGFGVGGSSFLLKQDAIADCGARLLQSIVQARNQTVLCRTIHTTQERVPAAASLIPQLVLLIQA